MLTDAHRWLGCVGFSHGIHGIHRSFWRRIFSHGIHGTHRNFWQRRASHRCVQMVRLRRLLWEDSLVSAWVWQGCHTLLICAHPCNLWENILRQKLRWVLWVLWEDSLVAAWVWQGCHTLLICAHPCHLWENILRQKLLCVPWLLWEDSLVAAWLVHFLLWQAAKPSGDKCTPLR